jgi:tetratricopeptide (TPR) repeat protein
MRARTLAACAAVAAAAAAWAAREPRAETDAVSALLPALPGEAEVRERDIALFRARVAADPYGGSDRARLASLYLQRARETGDPRDLARAEEQARASLRARAERNPGALRTLAATLMAQHRFAEARRTAERLYALEPESPSSRALLGETLLELGDYTAARAVFGSLEGSRADLAVAPRLARWEEVAGHTGRAREILYAAAAEAGGRTNLPREQAAWFHLRAGELELRAGRIAAAERELRAGLAAFPGDARLLAGMARLEAARGRWEEARGWGEQSVARMLDPATLALLSDAAEAAGDTARAAGYARVMEVAVTGHPGAYHRAWSLFLLDHGRAVDEVARRAADELRERRDVYGWDVLAWARLKQGRPQAARAAMRRALALGTEDAMLFFHAGMIARAAGHRAEAGRWLARALETNPRFHPLHAATARAVLDSLRAGA